MITVVLLVAMVSPCNVETPGKNNCGVSSRFLYCVTQRNAGAGRRPPPRRRGAALRRARGAHSAPPMHLSHRSALCGAAAPGGRALSRVKGEPRDTPGPRGPQALEACRAPPRAGRLLSFPFRWHTPTLAQAGAPPAVRSGGAGGLRSPPAAVLLPLYSANVTLNCMPVLRVVGPLPFVVPTLHGRGSSHRALVNPPTCASPGHPACHPATQRRTSDRRLPAPLPAPLCDPLDRAGAASARP